MDAEMTQDIVKEDYIADEKIVQVDNKESKTPPSQTHCCRVCPFISRCREDGDSCNYYQKDIIYEDSIPNFCKVVSIEVSERE